MAKEILVLESPWSDGLSDGKSVRPFFEGWALTMGLKLRYEQFHDMKDLTRYMQEFMKAPKLTICYIAGHGVKGGLSGVDDRRINLMTLAKATKRKGVRGNSRKGILLGACDVGVNLQHLIKNCSKRISWIAGYDQEIPWVEATLCDLLFLEYKLNGRIRPDGKEGKIFRRSNNKFVTMGPSSSAERTAKWVRNDFKLAVRCGLIAIDRK